MVGIYKITSPTGRIYIGQSVNIEKRFVFYRNIKLSKLQRILHNSFLKHGIDKHIFEVVEICDVSELNNKERYYQEKFKVLNGGLNCVYQKANGKSGKMCIETKKKMRDSKLGDKNYMYGRTHNEKSKSIISNTHLGRKLTDDHKKKLSENAFKPWSNKTMPEKVRKKISQSKMGCKVKQEVKDRISKTLMGRYISPEHRKKIGQSQIGKTIPYEVRKKQMKKVIDIETGIVFDSAMEAADTFGYKYKTVTYNLRLNGYKNKLFYLDKYVGTKSANANKKVS